MAVIAIKLGRVVRMVVDSILLHAECGPNDHRKDAPPFSSLPQSLLSDDFDALLDNIQGILMQYTSHKNNLTSELDGIHTD